MIYQKIQNESSNELKEISFEEALPLAGTGVLVFDSPTEEMNFYKEVVKKYPPVLKKPKENNKNELDISEMLPFLGNAELHEIVLSIINNGANAYKDLDLEELYPFLNYEDIELLFLKGCSVENSIIDLAELAPFISTKTYTIFVDEYLKGNYHHVDVNELYPFMSSADIKRLFDYYLEQKKKTE
ncbi:MAG: hypothetical protein K2J85_03135 [Anaeroplasmataceae bacterium]|nr:hypothetical protein [Anaeroplasmataceae bacterium]